MKVLQIHPDFKLPTKGSEFAGAYDIYMPEPGCAVESVTIEVNLGFGAEVPEGYVAMILPRSGVGFKHGVELNNTCGIIDSDYRGEWKASIRTKGHKPFIWMAGDRILQYLLVPVLDSPPERVSSISTSNRGIGGFGSSGT